MARVTMLISLLAIMSGAAHPLESGKLFLVVLGINAAVYQIIFYPKMALWSVDGRTPLGAKVCAVLSLIVWIGVIVCGRTMAYQF